MTEATPEKASPEPQPSVAPVKEPNFWQKNISASKNTHGYKGAFSKSVEDVKAIVGKGAEGSSRGIGFARVGGVVAGSAFVLGAMKSKDAEGNDRSGVARVGEAVLGLGAIGASAFAGRA